MGRQLLGYAQFPFHLANAPFATEQKANNAQSIDIGENPEAFRQFRYTLLTETRKPFPFHDGTFL
jgi:hypothetical protein